LTGQHGANVFDEAVSDVIAAWQEIRLPDGIPQNPDTHSKESASLKHHFF